MGMVGKIFEKLGSEWRLCLEQTRMCICGGFILEERELTALKNVIHVANERVWLSDDIKQREYNTKFSDALTEDEKLVIRESAMVVEDLLEREVKLRKKHVK
jgi:hypothetical protein